MAGTIRGRIDCKFSASTANNCTQEAFKTLFDFLSAHPGLTRRALSYGISGTGTGYWDLSTPFTNGAWALFEFTNAAHKWFLLIQFSNTDAATNPTGLRLNGGTTLSVGTIGIQMAAGKKSDGNDAALADIWNGTTNNNGTDTIPTVVWNTPASGELYVFPRSNNTGGTHATDHDNLVSGTPPIVNPTRLHFIADNDNFLIVGDAGDDGAYSISFCGVYTPRSGLTIPRPFVMLTSTNTVGAIPIAGPFGTTTGNNSSVEGGILIPTSSTTMGVRQLAIDRFASIQNASTFNPNKLFTPVRFDEWTIPTLCSESPTQGLAGSIDFFREVLGTNTFDTNTALTRAFFGQAALATIKVSITWDGSTTPGVNVTRDGIAF